MRKCIDMGEGRKIIISDKDTLNPDGTLEIPDIGLGEAYLGKASYVVYDEEDIDDDLLKLVCARKYNEPLVIARTERFIIREMYQIYTNYIRHFQTASMLNHYMNIRMKKHLQ